MLFQGIRRVFSTKNDAQYNTIGAFWDEMAAKYGIERLQGLGYDWTEDTIGYVMGLKDGLIDGADCTVTLPDDGWITVRGETACLGEIYGQIYRDGPLLYEIETFTADGRCGIMYCR